MDARVGGVDACDLGLLGLAAGGGTAEQDGNLAGSVMRGKAGVRGGLASGEDGELGATLRGLELRGGEGGEVEVADLAGVFEAEGWVFLGPIFAGEGGDAGLAGFEGTPEGGGIVADGGKAAKAGDDDAVDVELSLAGSALFA